MIKPTSNINEFLCQSKTNKDTWYSVNIISGSCSCPHWMNRLRYTGGFCKHYEEVMNSIKDSNIKIPKVEISNGMDAQDFVSKYGEEVLIQLKRNFEVIEQHGKLIKL